MSTALTAIANRTLGAILISRTLTDVDNDTGPEARAVRNDIRYIINEVLEEHPWQFANRTKTLGTHADAAPGDWLYRYTLPSDCLVPRSVFVEGQARNATPLAFDLELDAAGNKSTLVSDTPDIKLRYTSNNFVDKTSNWTNLFTRAVVHKLASMVALTLKENEKMSGMQYSLYLAAMNKAKYVDNSGRKVGPNQRPSSVRARD